MTKTPHVRYIPPGATKVADKLSDAVAYLYKNAEGHPCARVFFGKQSKPVVYRYYRSELARENDVKRTFEGRREHAAYVAKRKDPGQITARFEVGKTYCDRSSCDWDTIFAFKVISRTEKTMVLENHGKQERRGIFVMDGVETCKPNGTYSMCSFIYANRVGREAV